MVSALTTHVERRGQQYSARQSIGHPFAAPTAALPECVRQSDCYTVTGPRKGQNSELKVRFLGAVPCSRHRKVRSSELGQSVVTSEHRSL